MMPAGFFGILGLMIGSFLNVVIRRLPAGESLVWPGSHCPECGKKLGVLELVPVLGYIGLRGKCAGCGVKISPRYPAVEAATGAGFYWAAANAAGPLDFVNSILLLSGLIAIFFIDLDHGIIPDVISLPLLVAGLALGAGLGVFPDRAIAAVGGFVVFWTIRFVGTLIVKEEAMGFGDVKLAAMMGAFLGIRMTATGLFLGFLIGAGVALWLMAVAILGTALVGMATLISTGLLQLQNVRVQRTAANCARMVMEYLETVPPDDIYAWTPGVALEGDFSTGAGITQLNAFVNSADQTCKDLSDTSNVIGNKVRMKYALCPGCYSATQCDPDTLICWTSCYYFYRVKVTYNGMAMGGSRTEEYYTKKYHGQNRLCTALDACGEGNIPGTLKNCSW